MVVISGAFGLLYRHEIMETKPFVFSILDQEISWNWTFVLESEGELLLCVHFGKTKVKYWLNKIHNGSPEVGLTRETYRRSIFNLDIEIGNCLATFLTRNLQLEVDTLIVDLSFDNW